MKLHLTSILLVFFVASTNYVFASDGPTGAGGSTSSGSRGGETGGNG